MITTKNRLTELKTTCIVLEALTPKPDEVIICADGCTDDTVNFIRQNYPNYRLFINEIGKGSVASRDLMMRQATGDLVLSFDDDSYPLTQDIVTKVRNLFSHYPKLAVASFPQRTEEYPESLTMEDFGNSYYCGSFANSTACIRRSFYLQLDGFDTQFFHVYEEPDYALQCIAAGYGVYHFTDIVIRHLFTSTGRNEIRTHHRHARNEQWSIWRRCPFPHILVVAPYRVFSQFRYAVKRGINWVVREPIWWLSVFEGISYALRNRKPIPWKIYWLWISLLSKPIYTDEQWQEKLAEINCNLVQ